MTHKTKYILVAILLLFISTILAISFGFVSPDSWNYVNIAQSIKNGDLCTLKGVYFGEFPCGYPMAIAGTSPSAEITSIIISSKITNFVLLAACFLIAIKTFDNYIIATLIVFNPITIAINHFTWSENLFLFAFCGTQFSILKIACTNKSFRYTALLCIFLIIGCSSRYFFGPFSAFVFICTYAVYGKKAAAKAFPAFMIAGLLYIYYLHFNTIHTGFSTGMPRNPSQESILLLVLKFTYALFSDWFNIIISTSLLLIFSRRAWGLNSIQLHLGKPDSETKKCFFLALSGMGFLILAFALRVQTQFDIFGYRTIGYGSVFLFAALTGLLVRNKSNIYPVFGLIFCGIFSIIFSHQGYLIPSLIKDAVTKGYKSPIQSVRDYGAKETTADLIISLSTPTISRTIDSSLYNYYNKNSIVIYVKSAPHRKPDSFDELKSRVQSLNYKNCAIDFTQFPTIQTLKSFIDNNYTIDYKFNKLLFTSPEEIYIPTYENSMKAYLIELYQPSSFVSCGF